MLRPMTDKEEPSSISTSPTNNGDVITFEQENPTPKSGGIFSFIKGIFKPKTDTTLRETIEEYIEENSGEQPENSISEHEKTLISNILDLKDMKASDIMIPRADIVAISLKTTEEELMNLLAEQQYSRLPVYYETLDNVVGAIHIKDIISTIANKQKLVLKDLIREIPIVSPSMQLPDLLLQMRMTRKHMVLVVDEFGGIDGLINVADVIEAIVGELEDEHDPEDQAEIIKHDDGTYMADSRFDLEEFEEHFGKILNEDERQEHDTLGGLVFEIAGRIPARGEIIKHSSGIAFEIMEADPRRIHKIRICPTQKTHVR